MSIVAAQFAAVHTDPSARYDERGDLYATFPPDLVAHPLFPMLRHTITGALPVEAYSWERHGDTLRVGWPWARDAERTLRIMYPDLVVSAAANPAYGQRAAQIVGAGR